ncbi:MAG: hypothetical protein JO303_10590 [Caulobacteraceae bacterium]|nr:hypothetical protein [Caulobacteraceae bacterium]
MIIRRALCFIAALAATAGASFVVVFALAFGVYALLEPHLGPAGSAGCMVLGFAVLLGLAALIAALQLKPPRRGRRDREGQAQGLAERLIAMIKDKPYAAAGVAAAIGLLATRNPRLIGSAVRAFLDGWDDRGRKR